MYTYNGNKIYINGNSNNNTGRCAATRTGRDGWSGATGPHTTFDNRLYFTKFNYTILCYTTP